MKIKSKSLKILDILSFVGIFVFFICSLICAISRLNGAKFTIFGSRYDVVLTDSMSVKNENHVEFLENDEQIQAFDLVKSIKINNPDEIKEHDVVIFKDRKIGTNMHRIVKVEEDSTEIVTFKESAVKKIGDYEGFELSLNESDIFTNEISYEHLELVTYSLLEDNNHFNFNAMKTDFEPEISSVQDGIGKLTTYKITRNSTAPCKTHISHKLEYDFSKEIIVSLKIDSVQGEINCDSTSLTANGSDLTKHFNSSYKYEIRGDKANNSDGWYRFDEIESKVVKNIPKLGYFIRFLGSLWGGIMFLLLGILLLVFNILMSYFDKKEKLASANSAPVGEQPIDKETDKEQKEKPIDNLVVEENSIEKPVVEKPKPEEPKVEKKSTNKPKQTPQRVNGKFVSKKEAPAKASKNNSRWTKENNPTANKRRTQGGQK